MDKIARPSKGHGPGHGPGQGPGPKLGGGVYVRFFVFWKLDPRGPKGTQNNVFESILSPGPNVGPRDPKPKRCGPKNHAKPRLQNSKWCHMVQVMAKNHFGHIVPVGRIFCPHLFLFQLVWPNQSIEVWRGAIWHQGARGAPHVAF